MSCGLPARGFDARDATRTRPPCCRLNGTGPFEGMPIRARRPGRVGGAAGPEGDHGLGEVGPAGGDEASQGVARMRRRIASISVRVGGVGAGQAAQGEAVHRDRGCRGGDGIGVADQRLDGQLDVAVGDGPQRGTAQGGEVELELYDLLVALRAGAAEQGVGEQDDELLGAEVRLLVGPGLEIGGVPVYGAVQSGGDEVVLGREVVGRGPQGDAGLLGDRGWVRPSMPRSAMTCSVAAVISSIRRCGSRRRAAGVVCESGTKTFFLIITGRLYYCGSSRLVRPRDMAVQPCRLC